MANEFSRLPYVCELSPVDENHLAIATVRSLFPEISAQDAFFVPRWYFEQQTWIESPLDKSNLAYAHPVALRVQGPLNIDILQASLNDIGRRHSALRSVFRKFNER